VTLFYLSFAGEEGWRGACYVVAPTFELAVTEAHLRGCNPGGEIAGWDVDFLADDLGEEWRNRVLQKVDLRRLDASFDGDGETVGGTPEDLTRWIETGEAPPGVVDGG
jgi:hypothetical protein